MARTASMVASGKVSSIMSPSIKVTEDGRRSRARAICVSEMSLAVMVVLGRVVRCFVTGMPAPQPSSRMFRLGGSAACAGDSGWGGAALRFWRSLSK